MSAEANPDQPLALVTDILLYHVVGEELSSEEVLALDEIDTVEGEEIDVEGENLVDIDPDNEDASILVPDVEASNGVVHTIDEVLLPVDINMVNGSPEIIDPDADGDVIAEDDDDGFGDILAGLGLIGAVAWAAYCLAYI